MDLSSRVLFNKEQKLYALNGICSYVIDTNIAKAIYNLIDTFKFKMLGFSFIDIS